jgi:hypothetical protein
MDNPALAQHVEYAQSTKGKLTGSNFPYSGKPSMTEPG